MIETIEFKHAHMACGAGGGAKGFNEGETRIGNVRLKFRCLGGIDNNAAALRDFERFAGVPGTLLDLFTLELYLKFHGHMPPPGWVQATTTDIHRAFGYERPNAIFASYPCKGFSGLLSEARSLSEKYQALNELVLHGMMLTLEAYKDDPIEFYLLENVPRIATRGRHLLDQIIQLLQHYGYACAESTHDCGEIGNLAQSRNRFLLVARHTEKVPPFLYEPPKRPLRAVGDVLGKMHLPGNPLAGPMHRIPSLHWKTWVRLAFVEAGKDWRSLQRLRVADDVLQDFALMPDRDNFRGAFGVHHWEETASAVSGETGPSNGAFSVADPRINGHEKSVQMGVRQWDQQAGTVTGNMAVGAGPNAIADPRIDGVKHNNCFRVVRWDQVSPSVTGGTGPSAGGLAVGDPRVGYSDNSHRNKLKIIGWDRAAATITSSKQVQGGALSVADPRPQTGWDGSGKYRVTDFGEATGTVIAESGTGNGAFAIADPRPRLDPSKRDHYLTAGHYGVVPWTRHANAVTGSGQHDNGYHNVADPRLPAATDRLVAIIRADDGTWHRPFTTLELAALQGFFDPEQSCEIEEHISRLGNGAAHPYFCMYGTSDSAWRERIGNAVPPPAAKAIASEIGRTFLLARLGETFALGSTPIWVRPIAIALSVAQRKPT